MSILHLFDPRLGFRIVRQHRGLLFQLLKRNVALRYRGSALGLVWSFAQPLMMLAVYSFVFGVIFKARWGTGAFENSSAAFPLIMFCGMAVYNIFSESVNTCSSLIVGNTGFVKKVIFPLEILPLASVLTSAVFSLTWFILLLLGVLFFLGSVSWTMLLLPITLLPLLLFTMGISFLVASLGVYLRDIQQVVGIVTQILFFLTPIFYPASLVPEGARWLLRFNPLSHMVEQTREVFLYGHQPNWWLCLGLFVLSAMVFQLGLAWFAKTKKGFADVL